MKFLLHSLVIFAFVLHMPAYAADEATPKIEKKVLTKGYDNSPTEGMPAPTTEEQGGSGALLAGRFARQRGDDQSAAGYLEQLLADNPQDTRVQGQLLVILLGKGDIAKAVRYAEGLKDTPEHEGIVDLMLAVDAVKKGEYAKAEHSFSLVFRGQPGANEAPNTTTVWEPLFAQWMKLAQNRTQKPVTMQDLLPGTKVGPAFLAYHLALLNDAAGHKAEAAKLYSAAVEDPTAAPFRAVEAAMNFYQRQNDKAALAAMRKKFATTTESGAGPYTLLLASQGESKTPVIGTPPQGVAEVLFTMASVLYSVDALEDAQLYLRMALYLREEFPVAQLLLASILEEFRDYGEAESLYMAIKAPSPLEPRANIRAAFMKERQGRLASALDQLEARAVTHPKEYDSLVAKGDMLRAHGRFKEAVMAYTSALARIPKPAREHWGIYFARGASSEQLGEWKEAEADLRHALQLNPEEPEILNYLGYSLLMRDANSKEAGELIEAALQIAPESPHIMDSYAWLQYRRGNFAEAARVLEQVIELMPGDATVNDHLGDAYWQTGRKTEAKYQWERALTFSPDAELKESLERKLREGLPLPPEVAVKSPIKTVSAADAAAR